MMSEYVTSELSWRKSSYSGASNDCVEVAEQGLRTIVRDSKSPRSAALVFGRERWRAFLTPGATP